MPDTDKYQVAGLAKELDDLALPIHIAQPIQRTLDTIQQINGSQDTDEQRHKELLYAICTGQIMHFRYVKDAQQRHLDGCPVNRMVVRRPNGTLEFPWSTEIREVMAKRAAEAELEAARQAAAETAKHSAGEAGAEEEGQSSEVTLPWGVKIRGRGKGSWIVPTMLVGSFVLFLMAGIALYVQNRAFERYVTQRLETAATRYAVPEYESEQK